jgi:two-component sensor histidine kinase
MSDAEPSEEGGSKERLADLLIRVCSVVALLAYVPSAYLSWREGLWFILAVDSFAFLLVIFLALRPSLPYALKVGALLAISYCLGLALLFVTGPFGAGHLYVFFFVILAGLFGSVPQLVAANLLSVLGYACFVLVTARLHPAWVREVGPVVVVSANAALIGAVLSAAANFLVRRYAEAASAERRLRLLRESMLNEIDHRVKNNLQMITSLVSLRSRPELDPRAALEGIKGSLSAIALVYKLLDREEMPYSLGAKRFLDTLFERFRGIYPEMSFDFDWQGPELAVDSNVGIDLGLIVDEIVVNSVKHAFAEGAAGRIFLRASVEAGTRALSLTVGDEGPGTRGAAAEGKEGQGRKIIGALAKHLDARMRLETSPSFVYSFELVLPEPA